MGRSCCAYCPTMSWRIYLVLLLCAVNTLALSSLVSNKKVCIAGAGPCGLFLASLLLQQDPSVQIQILEKSPRQGVPGNAFGIGMGPRLCRTLDKVHGLRSRVESIGARVRGLNETLIASRQDICEEMTRFLEDEFPQRCQINFEEGCQQVKMEERTVLTTRGNVIRYDVLIGADGVNSVVRRYATNIHTVDHYVLRNLWKALPIPPQPNIEADSFQPFKHENFSGRILPRHPEGHIALFFWDDNEKSNPNGVETVQDLEVAFRDALQGKKRRMPLRRLLGMASLQELDAEEAVLDQEDLQQCFDGRAGISHYLKLDKYNDGVVALLGDSAHGMYNLLGQGCACGLENAVVLAKSLTSSGGHETVEDALQAYSDYAVPESHAITDLNLIAHTLLSNILIKAIAIPPILWTAVRGKMMFQRTNDEVLYSQILKENRFVIWLSRQMWKRQRKPVSKN